MLRMRISGLVPFVCCFGVSSSVSAVDKTDLSVLVDVGRKYYDFKLRDNNGNDSDAHGAFTSSYIISPTVRLRNDPIGDEKAFVALIGFSYGNFKTSEIEVNSYDINFGLGFNTIFTEWASFNIQTTIGYGGIELELPAYWQTINVERNERGIALHGQIAAELVIHIDQVLLLGQVGFRISRLNIEDDDLKRWASYTVYGTVLSIGAGITF